MLLDYGGTLQFFRPYQIQVCTRLQFLRLWTLFPRFCPRPALQLLWARRFLLHCSMLIPPSSCLRIGWLRTLSLILSQFCGPWVLPSSPKVVSQIVSGKIVDLGHLLQANIAEAESEPQLFFHCPMILTSNPKWSCKKIDDIITWMEASSIFVMILIPYFPHPWKDLSWYKLLILRTYQQFSGRVWLNYDRVFSEHAAASRVTDWSPMNVQLHNFHAAGVAARGCPGESSILPEAVGDCFATFKCRSWNRGRCIAPSSSCRPADTWFACGADHRAVCPGHAEKEVKTDPKHEASSSLLDGQTQHGGMDSKNFVPGPGLTALLQPIYNCHEMISSDNCFQCVCFCF